MDSPLTCLKQPQDGRDADSMTSVLAYTKGCFFLKECEYAVGRERFDAFLRGWFDSNAFGSVTTRAVLPSVGPNCSAEAL